MNERIKELAKEAGLWRQHYDIGEESPDKLEQFAELIVRECANRCEQSPYPHPNYSVAIKKHFGVEE